MSVEQIQGAIVALVTIIAGVLGARKTYQDAHTAKQKQEAILDDGPLRTYRELAETMREQRKSDLQRQQSREDEADRTRLELAEELRQQRVQRAADLDSYRADLARELEEQRNRDLEHREAELRSLEVRLGEPNKELADRVNRLESLFNVAVRHIRELWAWIRAGAIPPAPDLPMDLHDAVDLPVLSTTTEIEQEGTP